jgi:hypothetical protein
MKPLGNVGPKTQQAGSDNQVLHDATPRFRWTQHFQVCTATVYRGCIRAEYGVGRSNPLLILSEVTSTNARLRCVMAVLDAGGSAGLTSGRGLEGSGFEVVGRYASE